MSWFSKRDSDPAPVPGRAQLSAGRPAAATPAASASSPGDPSLEIEVESADSSFGGEASRTVIANDTTVRGHVTTASDLFVAGQIEGDIESGASVHVTNEGVVAGDITAIRVRIDEGGGVEGQITANEIRIDGRVRGDLAAVGRLELGESAEVVGDVRARTLHVEEGATLQGALHERLTRLDIIGPGTRRRSTGRIAARPPVFLRPGPPPHPRASNTPPGRQVAIPPPRPGQRRRPTRTPQTVERRERLR